jgi:hypothetical protein
MGETLGTCPACGQALPAGRCQACGGPLPPYQGRGRPPAYCSKRCRRRAERRLAAGVAWAGSLPDADDLGAVKLDVDEWNRAMRRMR